MKKLHKEKIDNSLTSQQQRNKSLYTNIIVTLSALSIIPIYLFGLNVLYLLLFGIISAFVIDYIMLLISGKRSYEKYDFSFVVTGMITVLLMPATVPYWVVLVSLFISICIAKHPFGGNSKTIFNPTAVGVAFCAICWPEYVLKYPVPQVRINWLEPITNFQFGETPASILRVGGIPKIDKFDVLLGNFSGALGTTCMLVLACCFIYLASRKTIYLKVCLPAFFVILASAVLFPRVDSNILASIMFEFASGAAVFGIIFMANEPSALPKSRKGKVLYGFILGVIIMIFRHFGAIELEFVYAILLANIFAIPCDRYANYIDKKTRQLFERFTSSEQKSKKVVSENNG